MKVSQRKPDMGLYAGLMDEIKLRLRTIDRKILPSTDIPGAISGEICYLQLRICCEVLALGCLIAHGDIVATKMPSLHKKYMADDIMKRLERIHPDFYPHPGRWSYVVDRWRFDKYDGPFLTKAEMFKLYRKCGDVLHRGSLNKLLSTKAPLEHEHPQIAEFVKKMWNLLNQHRIALHTRAQWICVLENEADNNRVGVVQTAAPHA